MKGMNKQIIAFASLILLCPNFAIAQDRQEVSGSTGVLRIKTDVSEVQVILDDKEVGQTPLTLRQVATGTHRLMLVKAGYEDHAQQIQITANKTEALFIVMKPVSVPMPDLPAEFKVLHQHRLGYCVGLLTITGEALDYKAEKDEDKFHIPIQSLKSVSRSWGPVPGTAPGGVNAPTDMMAMRVEAPGRSYGFLAYDQTISDKMEIASKRTKELYEIVYRLWTATLNQKAK